MDGVLFDMPFLFDENMDYGAEYSSSFIESAIVLEPAANRYTIKFDANGGSGTMADLSLTYTPGSKLPANAFTKAGCTFVGWKIKSCTYYRSEEKPAIIADITSAPYQASYADEASYIPGNDQETVIFEAQWEEIPTSPETGDSSSLALGLALIIVSGGALIGMAVNGKKRKYFENS